MPENKKYFSNVDISKEAYGSKDNDNCQLRFLKRINLKEAAKKAIEELEKFKDTENELPFA
jgi:leucyl-tRNA synthetase